MLQSLRKAVKELSPNMIVVTGDITQRATRRQFTQAKRFFDSLSPTPLICCPGNHDISLFNVISRLFFPYRKFATILKARPESFISHPELEILIVNSTSRFRHVDGKLDMNYLTNQLKTFTSAAKWRVVALHHPLDCKQQSDEKNLLLNASEVMQAFSDSGVDLIIGGHIHDPFITTSAQRYPSLHKKIVISVCGTGVSHRTRRNAPNSFMLYDFEKQPSLLKNHQFDYENSTHNFKIVSEISF